MLEPGHRRILDVGCGAAAMGHMWKLADPSREIWGLELNPGAARIAENRIDRVLQVDLDRLDELPPDAGTFDLITCADVLEHLRDPGRLLSFLARHLTPGGEIISCVPNVSHWSVIGQLLQSRFDYQPEGLLDRTHIHFFTPTTFHELLTSVGLLAVTDIVPIMYPNPLSEQMAQFGAVMAGKPGMAGDLHRHIDTYQVVFRARRPIAGPMVRFVTYSTGSAAEGASIVNTFRAAFRAGEPVRLTVAAASSQHLAEIAALTTAGDKLARPPVDYLVVDRHSELTAHLPLGPDRVIAVREPEAGVASDTPTCHADRVAMVEAARMYAV